MKLCDLRSSRWTMLAVLVLAYICSGIDRLVVTLLIDPVRADLDIGDTEIGLLQGLASLLIYALAAMPAGWLIDRVHRLRLIAAGVALWSILTALCGFAPNFALLFVGRAGVGVGEAVLTPGAYSLIADRFEARQQGLAIGLYQAAAGLGAGISLIIGGQLIAALIAAGPQELPIVGVLQPWRIVFLAVGLPGLLIAMLLLSLAEPARALGSEETGGDTGKRAAIVRFYAENRAVLLCHHLAVGFTGLVFNGTLTWIAPFITRIHGLTAADAGMVAGFAIIVGSLGLLAGGIVSDRLRGISRLGRYIVCVIASATGVAAALAYPVIADDMLAVLLVTAVLLCAGAPIGAATAALQEITPNGIKGVVSSLFLLVFSLLSALGPIAIGTLSDAIGLQQALLIVCPPAFLMAFLLFTVVSQLGRAERRLH